jgi:hypothetical protein
MKKILINGCSHAAGSECSTSFGNILASRVPASAINIAHPGGSNHRIMRTTMQWLETYSRPDFVLIAWSTHERFEFSFDNSLTDYTLCKTSEQESLEKFYRYADLHLADWNVGLDFTLSYQLALQSYLQNNNIPYLYCNMFNSIPNECQNPLWKAIDTSKYYKPHVGLIEHYLEQYPTKFSDTKHATDPAIHEMIADELMQMFTI